MHRSDKVFDQPFLFQREQCIRTNSVMGMKDVGLMVFQVRLQMSHIGFDSSVDHVKSAGVLDSLNGDQFQLAWGRAEKRLSRSG